MSFKPVTHVIFDLDGLLLNTEELFTRANSEVLAKYGKEFTWEIKQAQMGRNTNDAIRTILEMSDLTHKVSISQYDEPYKALLCALFPSAQLMPGAEKLIRHFHKHKIPQAICSGSSAHTYALKTTHHGPLMSLMSHIVPSGSDPEVKRGKPAPDGFLVCASRFSSPPSPECVLVFEDAPNGVESALQAQMQVVMVPDKRMEKEIRDRATLCLDSLELFKPELFGLPAYD